jgi:hypothetical protein
VFGKKRLFLLGDGIAVDVVDLEAARRWYAEKLGLDYSSTDLPEEEGSMVLGYSAKERLVTSIRLSETGIPMHGPATLRCFLRQKWRPRTSI